MSNDILAEPSLKIKRAYCHIQELEMCVHDFLKTDFWVISVDEEPHTGQHFLKFSVTKPIPEKLALCIGDAAHNLRSALDLLISGIVFRAGGDITKCQFPISDTREKLTHALGKGEIKKVKPNLVQFILNTVKPYKTGNSDIWALNKLDIIDKHRLIVPVFTVTRLSGISVKDDSNNTFHNLTVTVGNTGTIKPISTFPKLHIQSYGQPDIVILFDKGQPFAGEPVIPKLHQLAKLTTSVIESFRTIAT